MRLSGIYFRLFGSYRVTCPRRYAERLMNAVMREALPHGEAVFNGAGDLCFRIPRKELAKLRRIIDKSGVLGYSVIGEGLPFAAYRYRRRTGFIAGAALFCAAAFISTLFVWRVEIVGCKTISPAAVEHNLAGIGVGVGNFLPGKDFWQLSTRYLAEYDDCSWLSINAVGTTLKVELRERIAAPGAPDAGEPCNVVAAEDGVIESFVIRAGRGYVVANTAVKKGDLLVSGVIEDLQGEVRLCRADAEVCAEVEKTVAVYRPFAHEVREPTGVSNEKSALLFFGHEIPLPFGSAPEGEGREVRELESYAVLPDGLTLPFGVKRTVSEEFAVHTDYYTEEQARSLARDALEREIARCAAGARILEADLTIETDENGVSAAARLRCVRDIAEQRKIEVG